MTELGQRPDRPDAFGEQAQRCRRSACCACLARGRVQLTPSVPHHELPRGRDQKSADADTVPLCNACHQERHDVGIDTFWARTGLSWRYVRDRMREGAIWSDLEALPF